MELRKNIQAYILCGGKSSRMQTEKGLVAYQNKPMIQWVIDAVTPITSNTTLVTSNPLYSSFGKPMISDIHPNQGPIGGIYTALENSSSKWNLILSCDLAGITTQVVNYLIEHTPQNAQVSYISKTGKSYPLLAIYQKNTLSIFENNLLNNQLKLHQCIQELEPHEVILPKDLYHEVQNINSQKELRNLILQSV